MTLLSAQGITFRSAEGVLLLDGVGIELAAGEVADVTGPSGSGKTTLLRALARLLPAATGRLVLAGEDSSAIPAQAWRARVALLPQTPAIRPGTVRENLLLPWRLKVHAAEGSASAPDDRALLSALDSVGLAADIGLDRDAARLSVGQAARVALLRVMLTAPEVLLLDEPDAALDEESATLVATATAEAAARGAAVLRVRHRGSDGRAGRRLRLAGGTLAEVSG